MRAISLEDELAFETGFKMSKDKIEETTSQQIRNTPSVMQICQCQVHCEGQWCHFVGKVKIEKSLKLSGDIKEEKHVDDGVDEEMKMAIANPAEKEEGWSLLSQKTILDQQIP